jgi:dolichol-phosphate mannosyltransferase
MKALICIPTYNERENIAAITTAVLAATANHSKFETHVLVVDDNSPDGTGAIVQELMKNEPRLNLLSRPGKQGLGRAYIAAFHWGLKRDYDLLVEMDADFSHRPEDLVKMLHAAPSADFAVGSRYVSGGRTVNWGLLRKIISRGGGFYARTILGFPLNDWTGGFNAWTRRVLEKIDLDSVRSEGYSFQIELKYRSLKAGFHGIEVPIVFEDRRVGKSKMSFRIVLEAFGRVWAMRFS